MEPTLTPEQKKQLDSWVSKRDSILLDISIKTTESEKLTVKNKELASSNTEIADKIQQSIGRLSELDRQEINRTTFVLKDVAELDERKSVLQTQVFYLEKEIWVIEETKENLHADIEAITKIHEAVFARASDIERIISETVKLNSTNAFEIKNILIEAGVELKKVIDIGKENVEVTNRAIHQIPKIIVDIHKDVLERRHLNRHKI